MLHALAILSGLLLGSFVNAWVWRTYHALSMRGRSMCTACQRQLVWYELIPVLSYISQRGRCRSCQAAIPVHYLLVEVWMPIAFVLTLLATGTEQFSWQVVFYWTVTVLLTFVFLFDLFFGYILDRTTTIPAIVLAVYLYVSGAQTLTSMCIAIGIGAGFFLIQYQLSQGRWIGGGDIRLGVLMGVVLGTPQIIVALFLAYVSGAVISSALLIVKKRTLAAQTPFGTYLSVATFVTMLWGDTIIDWYIGLL